MQAHAISTPNMPIDNQPNKSCDCKFSHFLWRNIFGTLQGCESCHTITSTDITHMSIHLVSSSTTCHNYNFKLFLSCSHTNIVNKNHVAIN